MAFRDVSPTALEEALASSKSLDAFMHSRSACMSVLGLVCTAVFHESFRAVTGFAVEVQPHVSLSSADTEPTASLLMLFDRISVMGLVGLLR